MVNIAGMNIPIDFAGFGGVAMKFVQGIVGLGILVLIGWWWTNSQRNKRIYITPVTLYKLREGEGFKEYPFLVGGVVMNAQGVRDFLIKIPGQRQPHKLGYVPNFSWASSDDRLCFVQVGDGTVWQQCKKELKRYEDIEGINENGEEVIYRYDLIIEPVPTDVKQKTINDIQATRSILNENDTKIRMTIIIGFVIMVIAHLISLYLQTKIKCGVAS